MNPISQRDLICAEQEITTMKTHMPLHHNAKALPPSAAVRSSSSLRYSFFPLIALVSLAYPIAAQSAPVGTTRYGEFALDNPQLAGLNNSAFGYGALHSDTTGGSNTATGDGALQINEAGDFNTATGAFALYVNKAGDFNTATGSHALFYNLASDNTATGAYALQNNTTGTQNTAIGMEALSGRPGAGSSTGSYNTAAGFRALYSNYNGIGNVADGWKALYSNQNGWYNVASGSEALFSNNADFNTALGGRALYANTTGTNNTAIGYTALYNSTGSNNIALGFSAGLNLTTGSNNIVIGAGVLGTAGESNSTRIGKSTQTKTLIAGIYGKTVASGTKVGVMIDSTGKMGTVVSSARFKEAVKPMDKTSEVILGLKPVTFRYKQEFDPDGIPQFGLVAEEVEKVNPDLVVRDEDGKVNTVRYEAVNTMLLNEFLKEHRKVAQQESTIAELKTALAKQQATNAQQQKQIEALAAGLQKVSAAVELNKPSPTQVADTR